MPTEFPMRVNALMTDYEYDSNEIDKLRIYFWFTPKVNYWSQLTRAAQYQSINLVHLIFHILVIYWLNIFSPG